MKIYIICNYSSSGHMRGEQITDELNKDNKYPTILINSKDYKSINMITNSIIILVKKILPIHIFKNMKLNNNTVIYDIIDSGINRHLIDNISKYNPQILQYIDYIDYLITINKYMNKYICKKLRHINKKCNVVTIYHHWDPNITDKNINNSKLNICYIGNNLNEMNCMYLNNFKEIIHLGADITKVADYRYYNCHYNIRNTNTLNYKFKSNIKLSTAACTGSNIITSSDNSITELLDDSYPYIIKGNVNTNTVKQMILYVNNTYNTDIWYNALNEMKKVCEYTSIDRIIKDYKKMFDNIRDNENIHNI